MSRLHWKPWRKTLPADLDTPVSAFMKLEAEGACFLLESVERGTVLGRYSFVGLDPVLDYRATLDSLEIHAPGVEAIQETIVGDPLERVAAYVRHATLQGDDEDLSLIGGAVGYIGYDYVRSIERLGTPKPGGPDFPVIQFLVPRSLVIFDHLMRRISIVVLEPVVGEGAPTRDPLPEDARLPQPGEDQTAWCQQRLDSIAAALDGPLPMSRHAPSKSAGAPSGRHFEGVSSVDRETYCQWVLEAKEAIRQGEIFQVVLSQAVEGTLHASALDLYRALRMLNPSPYMYYLKLGERAIVGSSPELLVKTEGGQAMVRPIAGTRPRGADREEDDRLAEELLADTKERAEHVMLVDLGRNDLGRVCDYGSVRVTDLMTIERYSHVMHIVSYVRGALRQELDGFDLMRATFPAGTVSGAPKVRAMEIIDELENRGRGPYAGALGYFGLRGDMDLCLAIRTVFLSGDHITLQAGAGVVADSQPEREHQECLDKMAALRRAITLAEEGLR